MFDKVPLHIRETIFSRVQYIDLFETARVSQGWWTLTMASFERFLHKKDDFLSNQVDFCNQMKPKEEPWEWWMLMEFTKSKRLYLEISDFTALVSDGEGRLIQYFSSKQIHVKHLKVDKSEPPSNIDVLRLPSNLSEVFPFLTSLEVDGVAVDSHSRIVLPLNLTTLRFGFGNMQPSRSSIAMTTNVLNLLDLKGCGFRSFSLLGALKFHNLTRLSVSADGLPQCSSIRVARLLKKILNENKTLKSFTIRNVFITKEWLKIFPANVVEIEVFESRLNQDLVQVFGKNVLYERLLLLYVCEDWTSVVKFKTCWMSWDEEEVDGLEEEQEDGEDKSVGSGDDFENVYQVDYMCKPMANEETIFVKYSKVAINELISKNNQGLLLTKLMYYHHSFPVPIPSTVRYLSIFEDYNHPCYDDFEIVFEDPTALQVLVGCHVGRMATFPNMNNLRELENIECNKNLLVSILRSCTSLSKLTLTYPDSAVFGNISSDVESVSLKRLTIVGGSDTFEDIMKHCPSLNALILEEHCIKSILKSCTNTIEHLQYFKVLTQSNMEVTVHLSSMQFPYMMFACYRCYHHYAASKGLELVNEISEKASRNNAVKARRSIVLHTESCSLSDAGASLVFTKNIATRFMRNTCQRVFTVQDFIDKLQSSEYN